MTQLRIYTLIFLALATSSCQLRLLGSRAAGDGSSTTSENSGSGGLGSLAGVILTVSPAYSNHGQNWLDYVKNDGADRYSATDTACDGTETGYSACIHGGELRKVVLTGVGDCTGLALTDSLGVFQWACVVKGGTATFFSTEFMAGKGLRDLVDAAAWKPIAVTLTGPGATISSAAASWWTNAIVPLPDNSGPTDTRMILDGTYAAGTIFTLATSRTTQGYQLDRDQLALVTLTGATLKYAGKNETNCDGDTTGEALPANAICLVATAGQKFMWFEGSFDASANGQPAEADVALGLYEGAGLTGTSFSRVHNAQITGGQGPTYIDSYGLSVCNTAYSNLFSNVTLTEGPTGSIGVGLVVCTNSHDNTFDQVSIQDFKSTMGALALTSGANHNTFKHVTVSGGYYGFAANTPGAGNTFTDFTIKNSDQTSMLLTGTGGTAFRNLSIAGSFNHGLDLEGSSGNAFFDLRIASTSFSGVYFGNGAASNLFNRVQISNAGDDCFWLDGTGADNNILLQASLSNCLWGATVHNGVGNVYAQVTATNIGDAAFVLNGTAAQNVYHQILAADDLDGLQFMATGGTPDKNTISQAAFLHSSDIGLLLDSNSNHTNFAGNLIIGGNPTDCSVSGGVQPGLIDGTCTDAGTDGSNSFTGELSDATLRTARDATTSFVGLVPDSVNLSGDASGAAPYPADPTTFDFLGFENMFRAWGRSAASGFPDIGNSNYWRSGDNGNIWDWRLKATDPTFLGKSGDGSTANQAFVNGGACPSAADGSLVATDQSTSPRTYLLNAIEIVDPEATGYDPAGNHNGLCETGEHCVYTPNFGAYQGEGNLGTCTFHDGTVSGVTLYGYLTNGS